MKYGRLVFGKPGKPKGYQNIGDYFQTFAIDLIYREMGISQDQIINVDRHDLSTYEGEQIVLPLNAWFGYQEDSCIFSEKITPVFIGYHNLDKKSAHLLSKYGLIGCRDEATFQIISKEGVQAYISGCMTVLFPKRKKEPKKKKVFLVDLPRSVQRVIPSEIKNKAEWVSHEIPINEHNSHEREIKRLEDEARRMLLRYKDEATLVITSRLHAALPCMAMGIPVILLREGIDERFSFVEKFLPIYNITNRKEIEKVNWSGSCPDIEKFKEDVMRCACSAVEGTLHEQMSGKIHDYYMKRERASIDIPFRVRMYELVHRRFPNLADFIREKILFRFTIAASRDGKY